MASSWSTEKGVGTSSDSTSTFGYDATTGMLTSITDPNHATTTMGYTPQGWLEHRTDPLGNTTTYGYDTATSAYDKYDAWGDPLVVTTPPTASAPVWRDDDLRL